MLRFYRRLTWAGYEIAGTIAPGSEYNRQWQEANGAASDRIHPVYNGVDAAEFVASSTEPDVPTVVWLGRIDPLKDVETLIRSFAQVREQLRRPASGSSGRPPRRTSPISNAASPSATSSVWRSPPSSRAGPIRWWRPIMPGTSWC